MQVETTLNIEKQILDKINDAAGITGRTSPALMDVIVKNVLYSYSQKGGTRSNIIKHLFTRVIDDYKKLLNSSVLRKAVHEMEDGPPGSVVRSRSQTASVLHL